MKESGTKMNGFQLILERKEAALVHLLQNRDGLAIETSPDQMDEIQFAADRDLAISNVDRDSSALRQVRAALRRLRDDAFGICIECDSAISPKRLAAVPWAPLCIRCQEVADLDVRERMEPLSESFQNAA